MRREASAELAGASVGKVALVTGASRGLGKAIAQRLAGEGATVGLTARWRLVGDVMFAANYGLWALVAGASDGVGAAFAKGIAEHGVNVVLLAWRRAVLDEVAAGIAARTGVQTRTLAVDLASHEMVSN